METRKIVPEKCIAPGCRKDHKGPRFHWLCEAHRKIDGSTLNSWLVRYYTKVWKEHKGKPTATRALRKTVLALGIDKPAKGGRKAGGAK